ncbi:MAG: site-specific integrase [Opitutus sp.]|nr:site-specific integrase [Opitutus sp.]
MREKVKTWETTREPNLLKNTASGRFYGRFTVAGEQKWINLKTDVFTVAKLRLNDERGRIERGRQAVANVVAGGATMGELVAIYRGRVEDRTDITPGSKAGLVRAINAVLKTWHRFADLAPDRITREAVIEWRNRVSRDGTGFVARGTKGSSPKMNGRSASTLNHCIDAIRLILDIALDQGQLAANPLQRRGLKARLNPRKPSLPEAAKLAEIFSEIERGGGGSSRDAADFCRFLAYTGCRLSEAQGVTWADVDFKRGVLHIRGTKTEAANREVPLIPAARALVGKLYEGCQKTATVAVDDVPYVDPKSKVLAVGEAGKSLARACQELGVGLLTHHDLRDAFATAAIEAGVDIPTVAAWLGHADGGALLMRVYAHHRRAHSVSQAVSGSQKLGQVEC